MRAQTNGGGWIRLISTVGILGTFYVTVFVLNNDAFREFLVWVEYTSASPGLSGAFIMAAVIVVFLCGCYVASWIVAGFRRSGKSAHPSTGSG